MSELINKDYPDFVNLSTNLVDLDKAIQDLKIPLDTIKKDVDVIKNIHFLTWFPWNLKLYSHFKIFESFIALIWDHLKISKLVVRCS